MPTSAWIPKPDPHACPYCVAGTMHPPKIKVRRCAIAHDDACEAAEPGRQLCRCAERAYALDPYPGAEQEPPAPTGFEWA